MRSIVLCCLSCVCSVDDSCFHLAVCCDSALFCIMCVCARLCECATVLCVVRITAAVCRVVVCRVSCASLFFIFCFSVSGSRLKKDM